MTNHMAPQMTPEDLELRYDVTKMQKFSHRQSKL